MVTFGTQTSTETTPDSRGYYSFAADPAGQATDHIAVINYSNQPITLLVRPVDAVNTPQGGFAAVPINQAAKEVGTWISIPSNFASVNLAPRSTEIIPFRLKIPKRADPGDHFGVITATLVSAAISKSGQHIQLYQTVGTRVFIRVTGPLHPGIAVENLKVHYTGTVNPIGTGVVRLTYTVHNTGNVALGGKQTVSVTGLFGARKVAVGVAQVQLLLPRFSVKQSVTLKGIFPQIRETGHVSISPLYIAGTVNPASGPFKSDIGFWAIPWTLLGIIVLAALMVVAWLMLRRRRRNPTRRQDQRSQRPSSPSGAVVPTNRLEDTFAVPPAHGDTEPSISPTSVGSETSNWSGNTNE